MEGHDLVNRSLKVLSVVWQHSHIGMCCLQWRQDEFHIVDVNPAMVRLLALPMEQLLNRPINAVFSSSDHADYYLQAIETGQAVSFEDTVKLENGLHWVSIEAIPTLLEDKAAQQLIVTFTNVSSYRKTTEAALLQSEERFRSLFEETSVIGMQIYDCQRQVIGWNRASEELYGYTREEAMGRQLEDLIIPDVMREPVIQAIEDWVHAGISIPASELTLRHKNGDPVEVFSSHVMLTNLKGESELYCLDLDISDRKKAETTLKQAQLKMIHGEKMSSLSRSKIL